MAETNDTMPNQAGPNEPIDMILPCPSCGGLHVDEKATVATLKAERDPDGWVFAADLQRALDGKQAVGDDPRVLDVQRLVGERAELRAMLEEVVSSTPCRYDHHGYCQEHSLSERPCEHERARAMLTAAPGEPLTRGDEVAGG